MGNMLSVIHYACDGPRVISSSLLVHQSHEYSHDISQSSTGSMKYNNWCAGQLKSERDITSTGLGAV